MVIEDQKSRKKRPPERLCFPGFLYFRQCVIKRRGRRAASCSPDLPASHFEDVLLLRVLLRGGKIPPIPVPTCVCLPLASAVVVDTDPAPRVRLCFVATEQSVVGNPFIFCRSKKIGLVP